jgi:hypothetical protein
LLFLAAAKCQTILQDMGSLAGETLSAIRSGTHR